MPGDVNLQVESITDKSNANFIMAQKELGSNQIAALFDISLLQNNVRYEPNGKVTVSIPLPTSLVGKSGVVIAHIKDDGSVIYITPTINNNIITFQTDSFSKYAIVISSNSASNAASLNSVNAGTPNTGDNSVLPAVVSLIAMLSIAGLIAMRRLTKKNSSGSH